MERKKDEVEKNWGVDFEETRWQSWDEESFSERGSSLQQKVAPLIDAQG